jgi:hypothetical protein
MNDHQILIEDIVALVAKVRQILTTLHDEQFYEKRIMNIFRKTPR